MKKALKVIGIILGIIVLFIVGAGFYIKTFLPDVGPAPDMKIISTPEKIAQGKYLATHVMICMDCHSTRNWNFYGGPMEEDSLGMGGELFDERADFPGKIYSANITPAALSSWTDGEIFRAITTGVRKNGKPIFPVMPHENYGQLDPKDIEAIICYLRSIEPITYTPPESEYYFPMNFLVNTVPQKATLSSKPDSSNILAYGKYMIKAAACGNCHTPFEKGKLDSAFTFAGGRTFKTPAGLLTSPNITFDKETGIGSWTKEIFLDKFRAYRDSAFAHRKIDFMNDMSTFMPWPVYAGMSDHDLGAIYEYLRSLTPIKNNITKFQRYPAEK